MVSWRWREPYTNSISLKIYLNFRARSSAWLADRLLLYARGISQDVQLGGHELLTLVTVRKGSIHRHLTTGWEAATGGGEVRTLTQVLVLLSITSNISNILPLHPEGELGWVGWYWTKLPTPIKGIYFSAGTLLQYCHAVTADICILLKIISCRSFLVIKVLTHVCVSHSSATSLTKSF